MLEEVLRYINNRFEVTSIEDGFSIEDGTLDIDGAADGQYFWIEGSVFNDGLHTYPDNGMDDEEFAGKVTLLAVPRAVVELSEEISDWCGQHAKTISSPYQSESFGGYSYSKATSANGANQAAWQIQFGPRLAPFRKLSRDWS